ncbi:hypothetical protein [Miltoncostaea oceani]|uniref:hypothetical protein n=1 Tax=Miltoncostaea oceani TaxID=2843216 RepID=UPI001C3DF528|nr:hypothetical protein [Miltoncostaea oceani]
MCGDDTKPLTREHALPTWTAGRIPGDGPWTVRLGEGNNAPDGQREDAKLSVVTRTLCDECRSVLNDLEEWAQRNLGQMMDASTDRPIAATPRAQRYAASWAVKTVMMVDLCVPTSVVPQGVRERFFRERAPSDDALVWWAALSDMEPAYWFRRRLITFEQGHSAVYAGLKVGHLGFVVAVRLSEASLELVRLGRMLDGFQPIHGPTLPHAAWPPEARLIDFRQFDDELNTMFAARVQPNGVEPGDAADGSAQ